MKRHRFERLGLAAIATCLAVGCGADGNQKKKGETKNDFKERPVFVKVSGLKRGAIEQRLELVGELAAEETVEVASKLSGRIRSIKARMGDEVKKGELLVDIEDSQIRAQLKEARASLTVAEAAISRAEVQEKNAVLELSRKEKLVDKDLVTEQEMDNLRSRRASEAAALDVARAEAGQAEARIQLLTTSLKDAKIHSPFTGRVAARYLDPGAVVNPGTAIMQIIDMDPIVARFKVPERYLGAVMGNGAGEPIAVRIRLDALPHETFLGKVARVSPSLDKATRSAVVEAEVLESSGKMAPGMYCRVELDLGRRENALLLPAEAILDGADESAGADSPREGKVFVVKDGRAHQVKVSLGARSDGHYEVEGDLDERAKVVVEGGGLLKEGSVVKILDDRPQKNKQPKAAAKKASP